MPLVILFDIDGTLVVTSRAGLRGMTLAFRQRYGHERALDGVPFAGRTDRAITVDAMRRIGVDPSDAEIRAFRDTYIGQLRIEITRPLPGHPSTVLPGVVPLLDALAAQDGVAIGLLTGNFETGAAIKLGHFGLWERFAFGAFGDDHVDRRALVPVARQRAQEAGKAPARPSDIVIIGDTPHDIDCATAHGARVIGVATGPFDRAALTEAGAGLVVDTLERTDELMRWLI